MIFLKTIKKINNFFFVEFGLFSKNMYSNSTVTEQTGSALVAIDPVHRNSSNLEWESSPCVLFFPG